MVRGSFHKVLPELLVSMVHQAVPLVSGRAAVAQKYVALGLTASGLMVSAFLLEPLKSQMCHRDYLNVPY